MRKLVRLAKYLQAVAIDMSQSYVKAIREHLGRVDIVFDGYHISVLVIKAIEDLRKELQADLEHQGKRYLRGSKFLLLFSYSNLSDDKKRSSISCSMPTSHCSYLQQEGTFELLLAFPNAREGEEVPLSVVP